MGNVPRETKRVPKECSVCGLDLTAAQLADGTWLLVCGVCDFTAAPEPERCPVNGCDRLDHRHA